MEIPKKVIRLDSPSDTLDSMEVGNTEFVLNSQRLSVESTIRRLRDRSRKRFTLKRINDEYFTVKRTL